MNTGKIKFALTALLISSLLFSCQKERDNESVCSISMANLSGTYKLTSLKYKMSAGAAEIDYLIFMDDCERDDLIILHPNGSYINQDAGVACNPVNNDTGTWQLSGNTLTSDGLLSGTISSFNCTTLVYYLEDINSAGDRITFTMVKQ